MFKKEPSANMKAMYSKKRESSIKKVQEAIETLRDQGLKVTKKALIELTGLSSGTFSQPHIKEILKLNKVCQYAPEKSKPESHSESKKLAGKNLKLKERIRTLENRLSESKQENSRKEEEILQLRGQYQKLLEFMEVSDLDIDKLNIF